VKEGKKRKEKRMKRCVIKKKREKMIKGRKGMIKTKNKIK